MDGNVYSNALEEFGLAIATGKGGQKILVVDVELFRSIFGCQELDEEELSVFANALWSIIFGMVNWGYEVHPAQEVCGKDEKSPEEQDKNAPDALTSEASSQATDDNDAPR